MVACENVQFPNGNYETRSSKLADENAQPKPKTLFLALFLPRPQIMNVMFQNERVKRCARQERDQTFMLSVLFCCSNVSITVA